MDFFTWYLKAKMAPTMAKEFKQLAKERSYTDPLSGQGMLG